jgi:hypothetical protein
MYESSSDRLTGCVTIAVVLLMITGIITFLLGCTCLWAAQSSSTLPPPLPKIPTYILHREYVAGVVLLSFGSLYIAISSALFRRRAWARVGAMIIGTLQVIVCLSISALCIASAFASRRMFSGNTSLDPHLFRIVIYSISGGFLLPAAMGIWLAIFFARSLYRARSKNAVAKLA